MELNDLEKIRLEKIERLRQQRIDPYPTRTEVSHSLAQALAAFTEFEKTKTESSSAPQVTVGGRIRSNRPMGKLAFAHIEDGSGSIQLMLRVNELGQEKVDLFNGLLDLGVPKDRILMSLERRMKCGIGKCGHCNVGYKYTCLDGPIFTYWDALNLPEMI